MRTPEEQESRFQNAIALRDSGRLKESIAEFCLMAAETSDPNEKAAFLLNKVRCLATLGSLDDAKRTLREISELPPIDPEIGVNVSFAKGCVLAQNHEPEKAASQFGSTLEENAEYLDSEENRDFREDIVRRRAMELVNSGSCAEAIPILKDALSFRSSIADCLQLMHLYLGTCYGELRESDLARQEFLETISFNLQNATEAEARYRLARQHFTVGALAQAKLQLQAILSNYKDVVLTFPLKYVYEQLSRTCHYLGETDEEKHYAKLARGVSS